MKFNLPVDQFQKRRYKFDNDFKEHFGEPYQFL